jgi:hypothetical protein
MTPSATDFEGQEALFENHDAKPVPPQLARAAMRLEFSPSYVVVGAYRLLTDPKLLKPAWDKCRHAARRGAIVGGIWVRLSLCPLRYQSKLNIPPGFLDLWHSEKVYRGFPSQVRSLTRVNSTSNILTTGSSPKVTGLSHDTIFGYKVPFNLHTCKLLHLVFTSTKRCSSQ